ncbi:MAG: hypothetical protein HQ494_10625 [Rhodospirillales bacterium]|nr:hypothetical protein [Rhodospirillales bacterium]
MKLRKLLLILGLMVFIAVQALASGAWADEFVSVELESGETQGFLFDAPDNPVGSLILFAGGHGWLNLSGTSIGWGDNNFVVRTREQYVEKGFQVAVVDTPSNKKKINAIFRMSDEHGAGIRAVA